MTVSMPLNTSSSSSNSNISNEYRPTKKVLNLTLKKSIEQTLSVNVRLFGRVRLLTREGGVRGYWEHVGNVNRCSLAAHYVCENFDSRNCCCAIVRAPSVCTWPCVCVCVCEQFDSVKSPWDRATYRSEVTQDKQKRSPHQVCKCGVLHYVQFTRFNFVY